MCASTTTAVTVTVTSHHVRITSQRRQLCTAYREHSQWLMTWADRHWQTQRQVVLQLTATPHQHAQSSRSRRTAAALSGRVYRWDVHHWAASVVNRCALRTACCQRTLVQRLNESRSVYNLQTWLDVRLQIYCGVVHFRTWVILTLTLILTLRRVTKVRKWTNPDLLWSNISGACLIFFLVHLQRNIYCVA